MTLEKNNNFLKPIHFSLNNWTPCLEKVINYFYALILIKLLCKQSKCLIYFINKI